MPQTLHYRPALIDSLISNERINSYQSVFHPANGRGTDGRVPLERARLRRVVPVDGCRGNHLAQRHRPDACRRPGALLVGGRQAALSLLRARCGCAASGAGRARQLRQGDTQLCCRAAPPSRRARQRHTAPSRRHRQDGIFDMGVPAGCRVHGTRVDLAQASVRRVSWAVAGASGGRDAGPCA